MSHRETPLVSVVMPMYNVENYVEDAVVSLARQTYGNIEVVFVDDGCTDETTGIAVGTAKALALRHICLRGENHGVSAARNSGVAESSGDYVMCFDADDLLDPEAIGNAIDLMLERGLQAAVLNFHCVPEGAHEWRTLAIGEDHVLSQGDALLAHLLRTRNMAAPAFVTTHEFALACPYREKARYSEDIMHVWDMLLACDSIGCVGSERYGYRTRPGSTMAASRYEKVEQGVIDFKSFAQGLPADKVNPSWVYGRWLLGTLHVMAKRSTWDDFRRIAEAGDAKMALACLRNFPQLKVRALAAVGFANMRLLNRVLSRM